MDTLQKIFEKELQDSFTFPVVGAKLIRRQLEKKGVILTEEQVDELEKKLQDISGDSINFDFNLDDEQNKVLGISNSEKVERDIGEEKTLTNIITSLSQKWKGHSLK